MSINDGGSAFPHPQGWTRNSECGAGMSLRDYFAAKAMQALLSSPDRPDSAEELAAYAYANADAMLAERARASK